MSSGSGVGVSRFARLAESRDAGYLRIRDGVDSEHGLTWDMKGCMSS